MLGNEQWAMRTVLFPLIAVMTGTGTQHETRNKVWQPLYWLNKATCIHMSWVTPVRDLTFCFIFMV